MNKYICKGRALLVFLCILLLLVVTLGSLIFNCVSTKENVGAADIRNQGSASILNLNSSGEFANNFNDALQGGQNEFIYFGENFNNTHGNKGTYAHTGAIKWRVLAKNDTKYSNGSILLWSDYMIGVQRYHTRQSNPYYAYWGTSEIRAVLNGGDFISDVMSPTVLPTATTNITADNSWFNQIFSERERNSIQSSKIYDTNDWGYGTTKSYYKTTNIVGTGNGQYSTTGINGVPGTYATQVGTSVIEKTSDKLFLLDYYDVNNLAYGFGDDGLVYAKKVDSSWTESSEFYPGYHDNSGSIRSDYLKNNGDLAEHCWLRQAGRYNTYSVALCIHANGSVSHDVVTNPYGIRPAINLDPESVIYATGSDVSSNSTVFSQVSTINGDKPAYKVYLKTADYVNYNENISSAPEITLPGNSISIKKPGQSGKAIILLADKSGNGEVKYQATAEFTGGVATATLPSGVDASGYSLPMR